MTWCNLRYRQMPSPYTILPTLNPNDGAHGFNCVAYYAPNSPKWWCPVTWTCVWRCRPHILRNYGVNERRSAATSLVSTDNTNLHLSLIWSIFGPPHTAINWPLFRLNRKSSLGGQCLCVYMCVCVSLRLSACSVSVPLYMWKHAAAAAASPVLDA